MASEPNFRLIGGHARKPEGELLQLPYIGQFLVGFTENILHYMFHLVGLTQFGAGSLHAPSDHNVRPIGPKQRCRLHAFTAPIFYSLALMTFLRFFTYR